MNEREGRGDGEMPVRPAISCPPAAREWLANARRPRLLHVFEQACNLIDDRGAVLSLVTPRVGDGPFHIVVDGPPFDRHLNLHSPLSIGPGKLRLGDWTIEVNAAEPWDPRPDWEALHARRGYILLRVQSWPVRPGAAEPLQDRVRGSRERTGPCDSLPDPEPANRLARSLAAADDPASRAAAGRLAGWGIGLTPSGDDFILGALLAARILHPPGTSEPLTRGTALAAAPRTASLSAAYLRSAGRGEADIRWHALFEALLCGDVKAEAAAVDRIHKMGHTSGADALAGFIAVFRSWTRSEEEYAAISAPGGGPAGNDPE